ncbi:MAG: acyl carrier protein [Archangiaceae bacterium]|nr:acyl carrier protein [Archangiaceae bacterium]
MTTLPAPPPQPSPPKLRAELRELIVRACGLSHVTPAQIADDALLFGPESPVGLNSLDAVEIAVSAELEYGVKLENSSSAREYFRSVESLAGHLAARMTPEKLAAFRD